MAKIYFHLSEFYGNFPRKRVGSNSLTMSFYDTFNNIRLTWKKLYMKKVVVVISILLSACGGAVTEARTDTAAADVDKAMPQSNTTIPESIDVRHKYSYVKLIEDGSKVAGLLELYGTNDYTQAVTINGYTQSGRGTFYVNGDKVTLSRTSGIAIDGVLDITKGSDNKLWLTLTNGVTYVEDDNSSFLKSMTVTPSLSNVNSDVNTDNTTSQNTQPAEIVYQGTMTDTQSGVSQDYTLYLKSDWIPINES